VQGVDLDSRRVWSPRGLREYDMWYLHEFSLATGALLRVRRCRMATVSTRAIARTPGPSGFPC